MSFLPVRPADNSRVLDTNKFMARLYTEDGGVKYIRRCVRVLSNHRIPWSCLSLHSLESISLAQHWGVVASAQWGGSMRRAMRWGRDYAGVCL